MKRIVEFPTETGESVLVEVEDTQPAGPTRRGMTASSVVSRADTSFEEAMQRAQPIASGLLKRLKGLSDPPDAVQVEFGLSINAAAGAVLASASTGAHYRVTLTWWRTPELANRELDNTGP